MTAAQVVDVISRWLDCAGEASDTESVHTQVEMEDLPKSECPTGKIRLPRSRCPKSWVKRQDPVVPLGIFFLVIHLAGLLSERQFANISLEENWENGQSVNINRDRVCDCLMYIITECMS